MMRAWRELLVGVVVVVAAAVVIVANRWPAHVVVGSNAPDFTASDLSGQLVSLHQLRGTPVLLNFWATWCAACQDEMPLIQQATSRYQSGKLAVLAADYRETNRTAMRAYLDRLGVRVRAILDPQGEIADTYGVTFGLPVSVFVDRQGKVVAIQVGALSPGILDADLRKVMTG
jgi:thiol-disulfide isomerase/thioredoxin